MLPFGVTIPVTVPQRSEIPEGLMNNPVFEKKELRKFLSNSNADTDNEIQTRITKCRQG